MKAFQIMVLSLSQAMQTKVLSVTEASLGLPVPPDLR